ncbi:MAG: asparagine synthetase B, partial [Phycisphaerae bacterium]|nr:asparagine synthetase B [Phycisphaerae bacterium]
MCGIAGIYGKSFSGAMDETLAEMLRTLAHRGPDDEGIWISPGGECGLGHKRLSIIDPELGHQPLANEDETIWVTFNGCIYNYQDIARQLRQSGHRFRTHSDTEVIVHAYEQWGTECVKRFNGMWAFALWDAGNRTLFCSRDRVGIKPFYYAWNGESLTFASEIKAILSTDAVEPRAGEDGLRQYLTYQFCLDDHTLFEGVRKLQPGHNMILKAGKSPEITKYWDINFEIDTEHDES